MAQATSIVMPLALLLLPACSVLFSDATNETNDGGLLDSGGQSDGEKSLSDGGQALTDGGQGPGDDASAPLQLNDRGLLARYYMDEATTGRQLILSTHLQIR